MKFSNYLLTEIDDFWRPVQRFSNCNKRSHGDTFPSLTKSIHTHAAEDPAGKSVGSHRVEVTCVTNQCVKQTDNRKE